MYLSLICALRVYFSSDFDGAFLMNSLGISLSEKFEISTFRKMHSIIM